MKYFCLLQDNLMRKLACKTLMEILPQVYTLLFLNVKMLLLQEYSLQTIACTQLCITQQMSPYNFLV
jgi:hypothetical protein